MMIDMMKSCYIHGDITGEKRYFYHTKKGTLCYRCKLCMNERSKQYRKENTDYLDRYRESHRLSNKKYALKNKEILREKRKKYYYLAKIWYRKNKHTEAYKEMKKRNYFKNRLLKIEHYRLIDRNKKTRQRQMISKGYVRHVLRGRKSKYHIIDELFLDDYKNLLILKRMFREMKIV